MPKTERLPEIIVFAEPNGSGKSTASKLVYSLQLRKRGLTYAAFAN